MAAEITENKVVIHLVCCWPRSRSCRDTAKGPEGKTIRPSFPAEEHVVAILPSSLRNLLDRDAL